MNSILLHKIGFEDDEWT